MKIQSQGTTALDSLGCGSYLSCGNRHVRLTHNPPGLGPPVSTLAPGEKEVSLCPVQTGVGDWEFQSLTSSLGGEEKGAPPPTGCGVLKTSILEQGFLG